MVGVVWTPEVWILSGQRCSSFPCYICVIVCVLHTSSIMSNWSFIHVSFTTFWASPSVATTLSNADTTLTWIQWVLLCPKDHWGYRGCGFRHKAFLHLHNCFLHTLIYPVNPQASHMRRKIKNRNYTYAQKFLCVIQSNIISSKFSKLVSESERSQAKNADILREQCMKSWYTTFQAATVSCFVGTARCVQGVWLQLSAPGRIQTEGIFCAPSEPHKTYTSL